MSGTSRHKGSKGPSSIDSPPPDSPDSAKQNVTDYRAREADIISHREQMEQWRQENAKEIEKMIREPECAELCLQGEFEAHTKEDEVEKEQGSAFPEEKELLSLEGSSLLLPPDASQHKVLDLHSREAKGFGNSADASQSPDRPSFEGSHQLVHPSDRLPNGLPVPRIIFLFGSTLEGSSTPDDSSTEKKEFGQAQGIYGENEKSREGLEEVEATQLGQQERLEAKEKKMLEKRVKELGSAAPESAAVMEDLALMLNDDRRASDRKSSTYDFFSCGDRPPRDLGNSLISYEATTSAEPMSDGKYHRIHGVRPVASSELDSRGSHAVDKTLPERKSSTIKRRVSEVTRSATAEECGKWRVGHRCIWILDGRSYFAEICFIGFLKGHAGVYAGLHFDECVGQGNGLYQGQILFTTPNGHAGLVDLYTIHEPLIDIQMPFRHVSFTVGNDEEKNVKEEYTDERSSLMTTERQQLDVVRRGIVRRGGGEEGRIESGSGDGRGTSRQSSMSDRWDSKTNVIGPSLSTTPPVREDTRGSGRGAYRGRGLHSYTSQSSSSVFSRRPAVASPYSNATMATTTGNSFGNEGGFGSGGASSGFGGEGEIHPSTSRKSPSENRSETRGGGGDRGHVTGFGADPQWMHSTSHQGCAVATTTAAAVPSLSEHPKPRAFFYKDYKGKERGPYSREEMEERNKRGTFTNTMRVKREGDKESISFATLLRMNGSATPFIFKEEREEMKRKEAETATEYAKPTAYYPTVRQSPRGERRGVGRYRGQRGGYGDSDSGFGSSTSYMQKSTSSSQYSTRPQEVRGFAAATVSPPQPPTKPRRFFYLVSSHSEKGPFSAEEMEAIFKNWFRPGQIWHLRREGERYFSISVGPASYMEESLKAYLFGEPTVAPKTTPTLPERRYEGYQGRGRGRGRTTARGGGAYRMGDRMAERPPMRQSTIVEGGDRRWIQDRFEQVTRPPTLQMRREEQTKTFDGIRVSSPRQFLPSSNSLYTPPASIRMMAVKRNISEDENEEKETFKAAITVGCQEGIHQLHDNEGGRVNRAFRPTLRVLSDVNEDRQRWIVQMKISVYMGWRSHLLLLASRILEQFQTAGWTNDDMPVLSVSSLVIFPLKCITTHKSVRLRSFSFGSIISNGERATHWIIENSKRRPVDEINAHFMYDQRYIEVVYEQDTEEKDEETGKYLPVQKRFKIKLSLDSIRRVLVDQRIDLLRTTMRYSREASRRPCRLILVVNHPPKYMMSAREIDEYDDSMDYSGLVSRGRVARTPREEEWGEWGPYEHCLKVGRGMDHRDESTESINEATAITLYFDEQEHSEVLYDLVSRLRHKTGKAIEFTSMQELIMIDGEQFDPKTHSLVTVSPYGVSCPFDEQVRNILTEACWSNIETNSKVKSEEIQDKILRLQALLEGILQRGPTVKIQLLLNRGSWFSFIVLVASLYKKNEELTLAALERMLSYLAEERTGQSVKKLLEKEFKANRATDKLLELEQDMMAEGFFKVHRVLVTPTRRLYVGLECVMGNRVLRKMLKFGGEIIRVTFRDDDGEKLHAHVAGIEIVRNTIKKALSHEDGGGVELGGRKFLYLGNSNSQMRDQGAYFIQARLNVARMRRELGRFEKLENIPKYLARFGQCFTQARSTQITIKMEETGVIYDVVGGLKNEVEEIWDETIQDFRKGVPNDNAKPYVFSDGVGSISYNLAKRITDDLGWPSVPSAIQIRHRGAKGLVCVDTQLDARNELRKELEKKDRYGEPLPEMHFLVRPSMMKFEMDDIGGGSETSLELVKNGQPLPLFLNRPLINVIDQVSALQSRESNIRITGRIEEMLQNDLTGAFKALILESKAEEIMREKVSFPMLWEVLQRRMELTTEPFMRSLLMAAVRGMLHKQLRKMQIRVPSTMGRSMFGVIDTTGQLQEGQVYVRVTRSLERRRGSTNREGEMTLTGRVMVTKNPSTTAGDVRMFEAVALPELELQGLTDVIVFPQHGPRPHPDQMAGSDLDGDEYSVIWDRRLFFNHNMPAMEYPSSNPGDDWPILAHRLNEDLVRFYIATICSEQIGVFCNAHLAQSDMLGIESEVCNDIAAKISHVLDFQKTGTAPAPLRNKETTRGNRVLPPEKPERKPEFMQKNREPAYNSRGVMRRIHDDVERYVAAMELADDEKTEIALDPAIDIDGWEDHIEEAISNRELYNYKLTNLMETYGVDSEAEICSGAMLSISRFLSESDTDTLSLFSTSQIIEAKLRIIVAEARINFFKPLCHWETELDRLDSSQRYENPKSDNILDRFAKIPSLEMKKKAVAMYRVTYESANRSLAAGEKSSALLSFPWIVYDVLAAVRDERRQKMDRSSFDARMPVTQNVDQFVFDFVRDPAQYTPFNSFMTTHTNDSSTTALMLAETKNLPKLCYVLLKWAEQAGVFEADDERFNRHHLISLICCYGLRAYSDGYPYLARPSGQRRELTRTGQFLVEFLQFIASSQFRDMKPLSLAAVGLNNIFMRGQQKTLHEAAVISYLYLTVNHRLDVFKPNEQTTTERAAVRIREIAPFASELPRDVTKQCLDQVRNVVKRLSGVHELQIRPFGGRNTPDKVLVSSIGNFSSFMSLRRLLIVTPLPKAAMFLPGASTKFSAVVWGKIEERATEEEKQEIRAILRSTSTGREHGGRRQYNRRGRLQ